MKMDKKFSNFQLLMTLTLDPTGISAFRPPL